ncbi:TPM domain-containing protein [Macrococcoides caseolyticum]|uniref:TPM domain-containing protein n=1 Tax=Macrococcoides caseolyticum TaxID=69966 RepID=UPI002279E263|nr:TPM domain-containing protein [Macrococcus caseolyticus]MCE4956357.1 TPM domain-containing protein [Macrococcus caseolyticus]
MLNKKFAMYIALFLIFFITLPANAAEPLPKLKQPIFVQDHVGIFKQNEIDFINQRGKSLQQGTTAEIMIMTMPTIGQEVKGDYALRAGREYGVGDKDKNNGIVILFNLDNGNEYRNRGINVQVGYGLEGVLNDAKVGALIDQYAMPDIKKALALDPKAQSAESKALYAQGLGKLYNAVYDEVSKSYGFDGEKYTRDTPMADNSSEGISVFEILIGLFLLYLVISIFMGGGRGGGGGRRRSTGPVIFFPTGGGFGGGFSSGGFSGGDFGSFGGGDFGGGGADRSF